MNIRKITLSIFVVAFLTTAAFAQSPGFRMGARIGMGTSHFSTLPDMSMNNAVAFQFGLIANRQFARMFALEANPNFSSSGAKPNGAVADGQDVFGNPYVYTFHDKYRIYSAQLPIVAKLSLGTGDLYFNMLAGPAIGVNLFGLQSRQFDDENYNGKYGYTDNSMRDLEVITYSAVLGAGVQIEANEGVFGLDARVQRTLSADGHISGTEFETQTFTIGIVWMR